MNNKVHFNETHLLIPIHMLFTNSKGKTKEVPSLTKTGNLSTREKKKSIVLIPSNVDHIQVQNAKPVRNVKVVSSVSETKAIRPPKGPKGPKGIISKMINNNIYEEHHVIPKRVIEMIKNDNVKEAFNELFQKNGDALKTYRVLTRIYHPDKNVGNEAWANNMFLKLTDIYENKKYAKAKKGEKSYSTERRKTKRDKEFERELYESFFTDKQDPFPNFDDFIPLKRTMKKTTKKV
jgi:hypothetical protein